MNDYAELTAPDVIDLERLLPATVERVWQHLVDPALRRSWLAAGPMDLRPGGEIRFVFHNDLLTTGDDAPPPKYAGHGGEVTLDCRLLACEPPRLLAFTWGAGADASDVRIELEPRGARTLLRLRHARVRDPGTLLSVSGGWHAHLDILGERLAGREPEGFWRRHTRLEAEYARRYGISDPTR